MTYKTHTGAESGNPDDRGASVKENLERRDFLKASAGIAPAVMATGLLSALAAKESYAAFGDGASNLITVGVGGKFGDITSAANSITNATANNQYCISLLPGRHIISQNTVIPMYTHLMGVNRYASVLVSSGPEGLLLVSNNSSLNNFTYRYSSTLADRNLISLNRSTSVTGESFAMDSVDIYYQGSGAAFYLDKVVNPCFFRGVNIYTSSTGIYTENTGHMYLYDTNIFLTGSANGKDKKCIYAHSGDRIFIYGGKFGTGYGTRQISNDPTVNFIGFDIGTINRFTAFNPWMIVRQNAPNSIGTSYCVRMLSPVGWVRLSGGYYQAETNLGGGQTGAGLDIDNEIGGTVEIYPDTRIRGHFIRGNTIGFGMATGVEYLTGGLYKLLDGRGGIKKCDTQAGDILVEIADGIIIGEQSTFIRIAGTGKITIRGISGTTISGKSSVVVGPKQYDKITVQRLDNEFIAW